MSKTNLFTKENTIKSNKSISNKLGSDYPLQIPKYTPVEILDDLKSNKFNVLEINGLDNYCVVHESQLIYSPTSGQDIKMEIDSIGMREAKLVHEIFGRHLERVKNNVEFFSCYDLDSEMKPTVRELRNYISSHTGILLNLSQEELLELTKPNGDKFSEYPIAITIGFIDYDLGKTIKLSVPNIGMLSNLNPECMSGRSLKSLAKRYADK